MGVNGTIRITDPSGKQLCELLIAPDATVALLKEMLQIEVRVLIRVCAVVGFFPSSSTHGWNVAYYSVVLNQILYQTGIPVSEQQLFLAGTEIAAPHRTLASFSLTNSSTIVLHQ